MYREVLSVSDKNIALGCWWLHALINRFGILTCTGNPQLISLTVLYLRSLNMSFILNQFWTKLDKFVDLYNSLVCSSLSIQRFITGEKKLSF